MMAQYNVGNTAFPVDQYREEGETEYMFNNRITKLADIAWNQNGFAYYNVSWPVYKDGYIITMYNEDALPEQVGALAQTALDGLQLTGSDADKVRQINDYVTAHVEYDYDQYQVDTNIENIEGATYDELRGRSHSSAGAFTSGKAVCDGYAAMFQALATKAGLQSVMVLGRTRGQAHAWNVVKVDGKWKLVDSTWNDSGSGTPADEYLLVEDMSKLPDTDRQFYSCFWINQDNPEFTEIINDLGAQGYLSDGWDEPA